MTFDLFLLRDIGISLFIFLISHFSISLILKNTSKNLPPGPKGWPILGVLPHLGTMPHVTLANMAKKFGPIMYLKMGTCDTIIASSPKAARAFLKTLDHNFLNRPTIIGATHLGYNSQDLVFAKYGPKWKLLRKLTTLHMLGGKALQNWGNVRENEVKNMVRSIHEIGIKGEPIEIGDLLSCAITNMVSQVVLSKRIFENKGQESKEFKEMVVEFMTISGVNIGDFVPFIGWMDLEGVVSKMKILHKKFDVFLTKMIEDHVKCAHERKDKPIFLDILMENGNDHFGERLSLSNIKALLLNLFTAGTDTSSSIIEWALAEMLRNPNILMAIVVIEYILGTLVHSFDWKLPIGVELNMDESFGLTLQKAVPLSAMVIPRLVANVYV
ncbi:flavonoid 3',5'-hydroxylase [Trifolium repens]|nr:flavonoid 3',5'-hydroxylase [Trifolium repens]